MNSRKFKQSLYFVDQIDIGRKKGIIRNSHVEINNCLSTVKQSKKDLKQNRFKTEYLKTNCKKTLYSAQRKITLSLDMLEQHLKNHFYLYYTNKPDTNEIVVCLDFDYSGGSGDVLEHNRKKALTDLTNLLSFYFPNCFFDYGSSGKSLNYYLYIDVSELRDIQSSNFENFNSSFPKFINDKLSLLSNKIKQVFNNKENSPIDISLFKFDSIKASMSDYTYKKIGDKTYYERIIKSGVFAKLPCPTDKDQESRWNTKKLYTYKEVEDIIESIYTDTVYLSSFNSLSFPFSSLTTEEAHFVSFATVADGITDTPVKPDTDTTDDSILLYYIDMRPHSGQDKENPDISLKTGYKDIVDSRYIDSIKSEQNAGLRSLKALRYLIHIYISSSIELTVESYRKEYRSLFGTGLEDSGDRDRLSYIYTKYYTIIKEQLKNSISTKIQYLIGQLKEQITEEQIRRIQIENSTFTRKIYYEDICGAALSYFTLLVDQEYRDKKVWSSKEETVPMAAVSEYLNSLKELKIIKNRCNKQKVRAIRIILEQMGWIKIVDENYCFLKHVSMRYILLEKHPYFKQYETIIGKENYEKLRAEKSEIIIKKIG